MKQEIVKRKLIHIYYNTSGNSGLYLNPIDEALEAQFEQKFLVNYYYPLDKENYYKFFFKWTEKNEKNVHRYLLRRKMLRKVVRFIELKIANMKILKFIKNECPDVINYSLTNMPDAYELLKKLRKVLPKTKIIVTCHDIVPFKETSRMNYQRIYDYADNLLVHTSNAIDILEKEYRIETDKILCHPFPLIDLSRLQIPQQFNDKKDSNDVNFLFIGVMREEKGVQNLIDAWEKLGEEFSGKLHIAGFRPENVKIDVSGVNHYRNFKITNSALSDEEYAKLVAQSDYVVFPYVQVGNSGVLSTVVSLNKVPITTALPTFLESPYCLEELHCEPNNVDALVNLLRKVTKEYPEKYSGQMRAIKAALKTNKEQFDLLTLEAYGRIRFE